MKRIDRHRGTCPTCGQENVCLTRIGEPYTRHQRGARHKAAVDANAWAWAATTYPSGRRLVAEQRANEARAITLTAEDGARTSSLGPRACSS